MIPRKLLPELLDHLHERQATVITGMRRVGKSTLLKALLGEIESPNKLYLDLEKIENRHIFRQSTYVEMERYLETLGVNIQSGCTIALDEIQLLPEAVSVIKYWYDTYRTKFLITGSSSFYLGNRFSESLAGRKRIFELHPLSFDEFLLFKGTALSKVQKHAFKPYSQGFYNQYQSFYQEFIRFGGFPEVVLSQKSSTKTALLLDILNAYIDLDVKLLSDYSLNDELYKLIRLMASRTGSKMDVAKLSSIAGINRNKVSSYLKLFEQTYFLVRSTPFTRNADREISQQPKYFFSDSGILNVLDSVDLGSLFENAVVNQFWRLGGLVNYYQKKSGQEIDLVWKENTAVEIKLTPTSSDAATLDARARSISIKNRMLVGMQPPIGGFKDFVWGGSVF